MKQETKSFLIAAALALGSVALVCFALAMAYAKFVSIIAAPFYK